MADNAISSVPFSSFATAPPRPQNKSMKDLRKKAKPDSITRSPQTGTRLPDRLRLDKCRDVQLHYFSVYFFAGCTQLCVYRCVWAVGKH